MIEMNQVAKIVYEKLPASLTDIEMISKEMPLLKKKEINLALNYLFEKGAVIIETCINPDRKYFYYKRTSKKMDFPDTTG
jgi:transcription initiation factor IIE alpha subunit